MKKKKVLNAVYQDGDQYSSIKTCSIFINNWFYFCIEEQKKLIGYSRWLCFIFSNLDATINTEYVGRPYCNYYKLKTIYNSYNISFVSLFIYNYSVSYTFLPILRIEKEL